MEEDRKEPARTRVVEDNLNPIFMQAFDVIIDYERKEEAPPIILEVYDSDEGMFSDSADFLGRAVIKIEDSSHSEDVVPIPVPKWHDIKFGVEESAPACGQILCSFVVVEADAEFEHPAKNVDVA